MPTSLNDAIRKAQAAANANNKDYVVMYESSDDEFYRKGAYFHITLHDYQCLSYFDENDFICTVEPDPARVAIPATINR